MTSMNQPSSTLDFNDDFDSEWYISKYIDNDPHLIHSDSRRSVLFGLDMLYKYFSEGNVQGSTLLDIGTGPTIHTVLSASEHVQEIYLSDYSVKNRELLSDWWNGKRNLDKMSIEHLQSQKYIVDTMEGMQKKLRQKVKDVLPIDITKKEPFGKPVDLEYDIITSRLCLDSACSSFEDYQESAKVMVSLLKPGGFLILLGILQSSYYQVHGRLFRSCSVSKEEVQKTFSDLKLDIIHYDEIERHKPFSLQYSNYIGWFTMLMRKNK